MKKYYTLSLLMAFAISFTSCNKNADEEEKTTDNTPALPASGMKIAYVELDTLMNQYQLYKDYEKVLTKKGTQIQSTLAAKQRTLESHAAAMQRKYESGAYTTKDQLDAAQAQIQNEQAQLEKTAQELNSEFNKEQERINQEARDSIQAFLKDYNRTKKYDYVMIKAGDNLLIANPKYDITSDIVKGLNKRYKSQKQ